MNSNTESRFDGEMDGFDDDDLSLEFQTGVLPSDFPRAPRTPQGSQRTHMERIRQGRRSGPETDAPVAQGRRTVRGSHALPLPLRSPPAQRPGDPDERGLPDVHVQGLIGTPRRAQSAPATRRGRPGLTPQA